MTVGTSAATDTPVGPVVPAPASARVSDASGPPIPRALGVVLAAAGYLALAVVAFRPFVPWDTSTLPAAATGDPVQMVWFLQWAAYAISHLHNPFFTHLIGQPDGVNLAANTASLPLGFAAAPITWLTSPIVSWNILMRLSMVLSALSLCLVVRRWTRWWPAAFLAGLVYGFGPYMQFEGGAHLHLLFLPLPPLMLLFMDDLFVTQRRPTVAIGALLGLVIVAQFLVDAEICADCLLVAAIGLLGIALRYHRAVVPHLVRAWRGVAACVGVTVALGAYPAWMLLAGPEHVPGAIQATWLSAGYHGDLFDPLLNNIREVTVGPPLAPGQPAQVVHWSSPMAYLGIPLVVLVVVLAVAWRRVSIMRAGVFLGLVAFLLCLGSHLTVDGHTTWFPLPAAAFVHISPLWDVLPMRIACLVALFVGLILAVGLDRTKYWLEGALHRWSSRRLATSPAAGWQLHLRSPRLLSIVVSVIVIMVALATMPPLLVRFPITRQQTLPPFNNGAFIAAHTPRGGLVLTLPNLNAVDDAPMLWQAEMGMSFTLVGAYAYRPGPPGTDLGVLAMPLPSALHQLNLATSRAEVERLRQGNPRPARQAAAACKGLPAELRRLGVATVAIYRTPAIAYPDAVHVVSTALGPPTAQASSGGLALWTRGNGWQGTGNCGSLVPRAAPSP